MDIHRLTHDDLDALVPVVEIYRAFCGFPPAPEKVKAFFQERLERNQAVTFIAVHKERDAVMGFVNLYPSFSTLALERLWILNDLGVSESYRGQGVANALIQKVLDHARETGAVRVELKTEITNRNARKLYKKLGFKADGTHIYYQVPV